jgi:hypothetical protein
MGPIVADGGMQVTGGLTADSTRVHGGLSVGGAVDATSLQAGALRAGETNVDGSLRVKGGLVAGGEVLLRSELFLVKKKGGPGDIGVHPGSGELSIQAAQKRDLQLRERAAKEFGGGANDYTVVHVLAKLEELRNELTALKAKVDAMK